MVASFSRIVAVFASTWPRIEPKTVHPEREGTHSFLHSPELLRRQENYSMSSSDLFRFQVRTISVSAETRTASKPETPAAGQLAASSEEFHNIFFLPNLVLQYDDFSISKVIS